MYDGSQDSVLRLLYGESEPCWWLDVCCTSQVFDVRPWDRAEPMEVHDRVIMAKCFLPVEQSVFVIWSHRGVILVWVLDREVHLDVLRLL